VGDGGGQLDLALAELDAGQVVDLRPGVAGHPAGVGGDHQIGEELGGAGALLGVELTPAGADGEPGGGRELKVFFQNRTQAGREGVAVLHAVDDVEHFADAAAQGGGRVLDRAGAQGGGGQQERQAETGEAEKGTEADGGHGEAGSGLAEPTLPKATRLINDSRSTADSVSTIRSPGSRFSSAPPGDSAMNLSPRRPLVRMEAMVSSGSLTAPRRRRVTMAAKVSSSSTFSTRPTPTPETATLAPGASPPVLVKRACTR